MPAWRRPRRGWWWTVAAALLAVVADASATVRYGSLQLSGNLQTQNLFRIQGDDETFTSFDPVQQRNTFRLQYEQELVTAGKVTGLGWDMPFIRSANLLAYYRFVYDSIYHIAPGGFVDTQDGGRGGRISDFDSDERTAMAIENVIREIYVDFSLSAVPVTFRIGRQQIVWGEALNFRALDANNSLDLSWHLQQEAGLLGKSGFDELRIPFWAVKMLVHLGDLGPLLDTYVEAYDVPFDFQTDQIRFTPAPWGFPFRDPFRAGLVLDAGNVLLGAPGLLRVQPCFDFTGNTAPNAEANADFSRAAETGVCNSAGRRVTSLRQGNYSRHDPLDVNQFGIRFGARAPWDFDFTLNYIHKRSPGPSIPGTFIAKVQNPAVFANPLGFTHLDLQEGRLGHTTVDPITRQTTFLPGYVRIPVEFYFPYVHIFGVSANYAEELTSSVLNFEMAYTKGVPIAVANAGLNTGGNGIERKDVITGAIGFDRPTWIRALNPRTTFLVIGQLNYNVIPNHDGVRRNERGFAVSGDVQTPNLDLIDGLFGDGNRLDELKQVELISLLAITTFYKGGSVVPILAWINDYANAPSMEFLAAVDYYATNNLIVTPAVRIFTNFGRTVDEPFGVGRLSQWDEVQLKLTYQF